jgi:hypothetical protein
MIIGCPRNKQKNFGLNPKAVKVGNNLTNGSTLHLLACYILLALQI